VSALLIGVLFAQTLAVQSEGPCPEPRQLHKRLALLSGGAAVKGTSVQIRHEGDRLAFTFTRDGRSERRTLPPAANCAEETEVAATLIAAWRDADALAAPAPRAIVFPEIEAAFVGALAGTAFAPGAEATVRLGVLGRRWAALLGLLGEGPRTTPLGAGQVSWGRAALTVGAGARLIDRRISLELRAQARVALLYARGGGFAANYDRYDADAGLGAGLRLGVRVGRLRPMIGVDVVGWLRPEQAYAQAGSGEASTALPRVEALLIAGVGLDAGGPGDPKGHQ
jgi:hypothetical protein